MNAEETGCGIDACGTSKETIKKFAWRGLEKTRDLEGLKTHRPSNQSPNGIRYGHFSSRPTGKNPYHKAKAMQTGRH
jgi:hypothetical protein